VCVVVLSPSNQTDSTNRAVCKRKWCGENKGSEDDYTEHWNKVLQNPAEYAVRHTSYPTESVANLTFTQVYEKQAYTEVSAARRCESSRSS
jgi:hypothetical protein